MMIKKTNSNESNKLNMVDKMFCIPTQWKIIYILFDETNII